MKKRKQRLALLTFSILIVLLCTISIPAAAKIRLNKNQASIYVGEAVKLKVTGTAKKIKWSSSDKRVATVNTAGKVVGRQAGHVMITAKTGTKSLTCKITVRSIISANKSSIEIRDYGSITITYKGSGMVSYRIDGTDLISCIWDKEDWTDHENQLHITGKKSGTAYIYITNTQNKEELMIKVTVAKKNDAADNDPADSTGSPISITLPSTPVTLHEYSYKNEIKQTYTITNIRYEIEEYKYSDSFHTYLYFDGQKTYDYNGPKQSSSAKIGWKLYDEDGNVVDSGTCYSPSLATGETFKDAKDTIYNLKKGKNYRLEILSSN